MPLIREHHFYVATAKSVFSHAKHGIVFVRDPISLADAARFGLKPLILYGVTVAGTPINWLAFSTVIEPRSFCSVLQEAWREAPGLRGYPGILKINRHVSNASPELASKLAMIGIKAVIADPSDKLFPTSLRSAHHNTLDSAWRSRNSNVAINSLKLLCEASLASHYYDQQSKPWEYGTTKMSIVERTIQWLALPISQIKPSLPEEPDWTPGPWLSAWEANLPPCSPRYFSDNGDGAVWLLSGQNEEPVDFERGEVEIDDSAELAKYMVASWPNKPVEIAKTIGITARQLQWFLTDRVQLSPADRARLLTLLSIEPDDGYYEITGPRVLIAHSLRSISHAYDRMSHGGDLEYSVEVLPDKGPADPSWRYLVFKSYGGLPSIIMIPRGSKIAEQFNNGTFINFNGQTEVSAVIYHDVVATCGRACISSTANLLESTNFVKRRYDELIEALPSKYNF